MAATIALKVDQRLWIPTRDITSHIIKGRFFEHKREAISVLDNRETDLMMSIWS